MTRYNIGFCKRGHELIGDNKIVTKSGNTRCRICARKLRAEYGSKVNFGGIREQIIQRDGEKCVKCGMTREEHRAKYAHDITVDHIDGNGLNKPIAQKNNNPANLMTLCYPCHMKKESAAGVGVHSQESIARQRTIVPTPCDWCGKSVLKHKGRRFCGLECGYKGRDTSGHRRKREVAKLRGEIFHS